MRIGLVTGEYPPLEGGVGAFTEQLARALHARGHEIHVITTKQSRPADAPRQTSALLEPVALDYGWLHPRVGRWRWPSLSTVADVVLRHDLEIVNVQYQAAAYNMRAAAIHYLPWRLRVVAPTVVTFHDLRVPYLFPKAGGLREATVRGLARRAAGCIATNAADLATLRDWTVAPWREIPIGSNIDAYEPNHVEIAEVRDGLGLRADDVLLGYFGFLNETKGADTLLDALARLDGRYHLVFIGGQTGASDPRNNEAFLRGLRAQIDALGLGDRVHWTGFLSPARVSVRRGTLMAVLAHGRPLVTTAPAAPTAELRHGENVWLVAPDDAPALAEAVTVLAADPTRRGQLGRGAREVAGLFDWGRIAGLTADFYAEIVAGEDKK